MPKAEKGTPKDIANKVKAKGLQKLKFYCQMCNKQCRDDNGFKCHITSETHLRNMKLFSMNAGGMMDNMSSEFQKNYLDTLRRRHGTKRVNANNIYQEVIQDRHHIHMNATKWSSLGVFVQYLGKTGKCVVEETERGWYVQYIERDSSILARAEAQQKRVEAEKAAEERLSKQMALQRTEAAKMLDRAGGTLQIEATELEKDSETKVALSLGSKKHSQTGGSLSNTMGSSVFGDDQDDEDEEGPSPAPAPPVMPRKADSLSKKRRREDEEKPKKKRRSLDEDDTRKEYWLRRDIIVRIVSKKLAGGNYFKRKAIVDKVLDDKFTAEVEVLDSGPKERDGGDVLRLDQDDLETVIAKEGKSVRVLNGPGRGKKAKVIALNPDRYKATLKLDDGTVLEKVRYEDFSKLA